MQDEISIDEAIEKAINNVEIKMQKEGSQLKPKDRAKVESFLRDTIENGKLPKDALGMSDVDMEKFYAFAYNLYTHGKYREAKALMYHMMELDPKNSRYPMGIAACLHQLKNYGLASGFYLISATLDPLSPIPFYYMYDCFKNLNDLSSALLMLDIVIEKCADNPEHAILKERSIRTQESLKLNSNNHSQALEEKTKAA